MLCPALRQRESENKFLDKPVFSVIMPLLIIEYLIKSGGGNGPVKPGNLRVQGAKSGGVTKDEVFTRLFLRRSSGGVFFMPW